MKVEVARVGRNQTYDGLVTHQRVAIGYAAQFAMDLMKVLCIGDATPGAEKDLKVLLTEEQVVARAVKLTELAFEAFEQRNWTTVTPAFGELLHDDGGAIGFTKEKAA